MIQRTFSEMMKVAPIEYKAIYGELPNYIDRYWFALCDRRPTVEERSRIEETRLIGKDEELPSILCQVIRKLL